MFTHNLDVIGTRSNLFGGASMPVRKVMSKERHPILGSERGLVPEKMHGKAGKRRENSVVVL